MLQIKEYLVNGLPVVVIDNFYTEDELNILWKELESSNETILPPELSSSAVDDKGNYLKTFKSIEVKNPVMLNVLEKIFNKTLVDYLIVQNYFWTYLTTVSNCTTKVAYYSNNDEYKEHKDVATITCSTILYKEPKDFEGGELMFGELAIENKNNRVIMFPSILKHNVSKLKTDSKNARIAILQFLVNEYRS